MSQPLDGVTRFRRSSVRIRREGVEVHVDPWDVTEESAADYILLTHPHYDNFSKKDFARVRGPQTTIVPIHWSAHPDTRADTLKIAKLFSGKVQLLERKA